MQLQIEHTINTTAELKELLSKHRISFLPREGKINLLFDHMPEDKKLCWEEKLSRYFFECGCNMGAKFTIAFVFIYLFYLFVLSDVQNLIRWQTIVYGFTFVIFGAALGKISGILLYKYLLHRSVKILIKENT